VTDVPPDLITSLHTFIGGFFPAFELPVRELEIHFGGDCFTISFKADLSYDFFVYPDARVGMSCAWETSMADPDWPKKVIAKTLDCISVGMVPIDLIKGTKRKGKYWACQGCENYEGE
jgi:hypothetical protein